MNFKMKALVAAVALTASMSASANMDNMASGDSSLILTLLDNAASISLTVDLGFNNSTFDRNSNYSWSITSGDYADAWTSFWSTANAANTQWGVISGDKVLAQELFTTFNIANPVVQSKSNLNTDLGAIDTYIGAARGLGNHQTVADGAGTATSGNAYAGMTAMYGTTGKINNQFGDATAALDASMFVWSITSPTVGGLGSATNTQYVTAAGFNPFFSMSSDGTLTYTAAVAAVPEADTWAMLLAGLGLMGFIARRRTAA